MSEITRAICWFSCGAASAVAAKIAIKKYRELGIPVEVIYQETNSEHPDNKRFFNDCEKWFGQKVITMQSDKYDDIWDVFKKTGWLVGPGGARCTMELKRKVAEGYLNWFHDAEVLGYTEEEEHRVVKFRKNNPERQIDAILIERGLSKEDCLAMIDMAGIELPTMYKLGYPHNNCIPCVKAGAGYMNKVRIDFPDKFDRMAKVEREMDVSVLRRDKKDEKGNYVMNEKGKKVKEKLFLDELDPNAGNMLKEPVISCGIMCQAEMDDIEDCED